MAEFFDKINATMSNMADKSKAKKNVTNLNNQIKACEKTIEDQFRQLGAAYYNKFKTTEDADLQPFCTRIEKEYQTILELKASINKEMGIRICEKCGKVVPLDTIFCGYCGEKLPAPEPEVIAVVEEKAEDTETVEDNAETADAITEQAEACEEETAIETKEDASEEACAESSVEPSEEQKEENAENVSDEAENASQESVNIPAENSTDADDTKDGGFCPFCGTKLRADALFCIECGNRVK